MQAVRIFTLTSVYALLSRVWLLNSGRRPVLWGVRCVAGCSGQTHIYAEFGPELGTELGKDFKKQYA